MLTFNGLHVILDQNMFDRVQVIFPRSKKKRIQKKFSKNQKNYKNVPKDYILQIGNDSLIMHPVVWEKLQRELRKKEMEKFHFKYNCTTFFNNPSILSCNTVC